MIYYAIKIDKIPTLLLHIFPYESVAVHTALGHCLLLQMSHAACEHAICNQL